MWEWSALHSLLSTYTYDILYFLLMHVGPFVWSLKFWLFSSFWCIWIFIAKEVTWLVLNHLCLHFYYSPPPPHMYIGITLYVCQSIRLKFCQCVLIVSAQYRLNIYFLNKLDMVVYYYMTICHVENLIHCLQCLSPDVILCGWLGLKHQLTKKNLQCQGHSEGLYNWNMTIFVVSSKLLVSLQPNLVW